MRQGKSPPDVGTPLEEVADLLRGQRRRWRRWFAGLLVLMVGMGFFLVRTTGVAHEAKKAATKAQDALDQVLAQRVESRLQTCLKDQKFARAHNSLVFALAHADPDRSAAEQAKVDAEAAPHYVAVPDCSPEGIAAFYAGQGGTSQPSIPTTTTSTTLPAASTTRAKPKRTTTTAARPTSTFGTTSTTFHSSPTTVPTPCTGVTLPGGLPCL